MKTFPFSRSLFVYHCSFFKFLCCTFCKLNCSCFCHFLWWLFAIAQHFVSCLFRFIDLLTIISLIPQFSFWDHLLINFLTIFNNFLFHFFLFLIHLGRIFGYFLPFIYQFDYFMSTFFTVECPFECIFKPVFKKRQFQGQITFKTMGIVMKQKSLA